MKLLMKKSELIQLKLNIGKSNGDSTPPEGLNLIDIKDKIFK